MDAWFVKRQGSNEKVELLSERGENDQVRESGFDLILPSNGTKLASLPRFHRHVRIKRCRRGARTFDWKLDDVDICIYTDNQYS